MTLQELWMVIVRKWKLVVALPLACALACGGYLLFMRITSNVTYTANAYVMANSQVAAVAGIANGQARQLVEGIEEPEMTVTAKADGGTLTVTIAAKGVDADDCIEAANSIAEYANDTAKEIYSGFENPYSGIVQRAVEAEDMTAEGGGVKYLLVAVLAGLFVAVCIVVVIDMRRRPVKTPEGVQELVELPVLEVLPAQSGERLLANVRFAATKLENGKGLSSVLVVPTGDAEVAEVVCGLLKDAVTTEGAASLEIGKADPLSQSMAGAYASQDADVVVVAVRQWTDTLPQLESMVAELRFAGAKLAGVVFAKEKLT